MKTPFNISTSTLTALRPLAFLVVLVAVVALGVLSLPTSPTGAQEPTPAEPTLPLQEYRYAILRADSPGSNGTPARPASTSESVT